MPVRKFCNSPVRFRAVSGGGGRRWRLLGQRPGLKIEVGKRRQSAAHNSRRCGRMVDYGKLNILLGADDRKLSLIEHIYAVQGGERRRIDYKVAASAIGVSPRTVGRYIARLSALKVLKVYNGTIQLAPELIS